MLFIKLLEFKSQIGKHRIAYWFRKAISLDRLGGYLPTVVRAASVVEW